MRSQVLFLDTTRTDVGTPIYDQVDRALRRSRVIDLARTLAAAASAIAFVVVLFWLRAS